MLIQFWMTLHNDFKVLCGVFYIVPILSILNQLLINCWHKKLDSNLSHSHSKKGILTPHPLAFVAPFNKGKSQGRFGVGTDECVFLQGIETSEITMSKFVEGKKKFF